MYFLLMIYSSAEMMCTVGSSETSVNFYQITRHILEDRNHPEHVNVKYKFLALYHKLSCKTLLNSIVNYISTNCWYETPQKEN
jgi:hypothetical protein